MACPAAAGLLRTSISRHASIHRIWVSRPFSSSLATPLPPSTHPYNEHVPDSLIISKHIDALESRLHYLKSLNAPQQLLDEICQYVHHGVTPLNLQGSPHLRPNTSNPPPISIALYHLALWALGRAGSPEHALAVMEEIPLLGLARDPHCWALYITACGRNGDPERVRQALLAAEFLDGIVPTHEMHEAAIVAYLECAEFELAMSIIRQLRTTHRNKCLIDNQVDSPNNPFLSWTTLRRLTRSLVSAHRPADIAELYEDVKNADAMPMLWWADLTRAFAQFNYLELAKQTTEKVFHLAVESNEPVDEGTLNTVLELAARAGDPGLASEISQFMARRGGIQPTLHHYSCLALAYGRARDYKSINEMFTTMRTAGHDPSDAALALLEPMTNILTFGGESITSCLIEKDAFRQHPIETLEHWQTAQLVVETLVEHSRVAIDSAMWGWLISSARRIRQNELGLQMYRRIQSDTPITHFIVHSALACCETQEDRNLVLKDMAEAGLSANSDTYLVMIRLILGDLEQIRASTALSDHDSSEEGACDKIDPHVSISWVSLMETLAVPDRACAQGCLDQAFEWLDQAHAADLVRHDTLLLLLRTCVRWSDARWRRVATELIKRGVGVNLKTVKLINIAYPVDPLAKQLARMSESRALLIAGARRRT